MAYVKKQSPVKTGLITITLTKTYTDPIQLFLNYLRSECINNGTYAIDYIRR